MAVAGGLQGRLIAGDCGLRREGIDSLGPGDAGDQFESQGGGSLLRQLPHVVGTFQRFEEADDDAPAGQVGGQVEQRSPAGGSARSLRSTISAPAAAIARIGKPGADPGSLLDDDDVGRFRSDGSTADGVRATLPLSRSPFGWYSDFHRRACWHAAAGVVRLFRWSRRSVAICATLPRICNDRAQ